MDQKQFSSYLTKGNFIKFGIVCGGVFVVNILLSAYVAFQYFGFGGDGYGLLHLSLFSPISTISYFYFFFSGDFISYTLFFTIKWISYGYLGYSTFTGLFIGLIVFLVGLGINFLIGIKLTFLDNYINLSQTKVSQTKVSQTKVSQTKTIEDQTMSVGDWLKTFLIMIVPIANLVMIIVWGFGGNTPKTKANWAKAVLIIMAISIVLNMLFFGTVIISLLNQYF